MSDYTIDDRSAANLRKLAPGRLASFYLFSDSAGKKAGIVVERATNENAKQAANKGQKERKARGLKQFCRGIILCSERGELIFVRYQGNLTASKVTKLLNVRMGKDSDFAKLAGKAALRLKTAQVKDKKDLDAEGDSTDGLSSLGVDVDSTDDKSGASVRALLASMEEDFLSEETFQEEFDEMITESLSPIAAIIGIDLGGKTGPEELAPLLMAGLVRAGESEVFAQVLASPEALQAATSIFDAIGEGVELGDPVAAHEYTVLGAIMGAMSKNIADELVFEQARVAVDVSSFPAITREKLGDRYFSARLLTATTLKRGMTYTPPKKRTALAIQPYRSANIKMIDALISDLDEDTRTLRGERLFIPSWEAAALSAQLSAAQQEATDEIKKLLAPLSDRTAPVTVIKTGALERLRATLSRFVPIQLRLEGWKADLEQAEQGDDPLAARREALKIGAGRATVEDMLQDPVLRAALFHHCETVEFSPENPDFLTGVETALAGLAGEDDRPIDIAELYYRRIHESRRTDPPEVTQRLARYGDERIEVNIKSQVRRKIAQFIKDHADDNGCISDPKLKKEYLDLLTAARDSVVSMLENDVKMRFIGAVSEGYDAYLAEQGSGDLSTAATEGRERLLAVAKIVGLKDEETAHADRLARNEEQVRALSLDDIKHSAALSDCLRSFMGATPDVSVEALLASVDLGALQEAICAGRGEFESSLATGLAEDDIPAKTRLLREAYLWTVEEAGLTDPDVELRELRAETTRRVQEAAAFKMAFEQCRAATEAFLSSPSDHGFWWCATGTRHGGASVALFSRNSRGGGLLDTFLRLLPEDRADDFRAGEFELFRSTRAQVVMVDDRDVLLLSDVLKRVAPSAVIASVREGPGSAEERACVEAADALMLGLSTRAVYAAERGSLEHTLRAAFDNYVRREAFAGENIDFLDKAAPLIALLHADVSAADHTPRDISTLHHGYVRAGAKNEVNLTGPNRSALEDAHGTYTTLIAGDLSDEAVQQKVVATKQTYCSQLEEAQREINNLQQQLWPGFIASVKAARRKYYDKKPPEASASEIALKDVYKAFAKACGIKPPKIAF